MKDIFIIFIIEDQVYVTRCPPVGQPEAMEMVLYLGEEFADLVGIDKCVFNMNLTVLLTVRFCLSGWFGVCWKVLKNSCFFFRYSVYFN